METEMIYLAALAAYLWIAGTFVAYKEWRSSTEPLGWGALAPALGALMWPVIVPFELLASLLFAATDKKPSHDVYRQLAQQAKSK